MTKFSIFKELIGMYGHSPDKPNNREIICNGGLQLIFKPNNSPACVKPSTADKLIERGWRNIETKKQLHLGLSPYHLKE